MKELHTNKLFLEADVIGIDEGQFFENIKSFILKTESLNKKIIISGLDGDYKRNPFMNILECIPLSDSVTKLSSFCCIKKNGTKGIFSKKITQSEEKIDVGSKNKYISVCRQEYLK